MLTESDKERFDAIMQRVMEKRLLRNSIPERDEEKIAKILKKWEDSAAQEHQLLLEARNGGNIGNKPQAPSSGSENLKKFDKIANWKRFTEE